MTTNLPAGGRRQWLRLWLLSVWAVPAVTTFAASPPIVLEHLTTNDGLPQGTVLATLQDSQGFVWFGTEDGLVRYDGREFIRYAYSPTIPHGLPGNYIQGIVEDAHHDLWIAVNDAGLARWNRATDKFTVYRHDSKKPASLASDSVGTILIDSRGRIWVGTRDAGIDVLDPQTGTIEHIRKTPERPDSLADDRIRILAHGNAGTIWVGTEGGLDRTQASSGSFAHFRHSPADPGSLSSDKISQIVEEPDRTVWISTLGGGINRMDRTGRVTAVYQHDPARAASLVNNEVRALLVDRQGHLWAGTSEGLDLLDRASGNFTHYQHDDRNPGSLRDSYIKSLYEDHRGLVWIGTNEGGVSRWNPRSWELGGRRPDYLAGNPVTAFADAPDQKIWIATLAGGLLLFDPRTGDSTDIDTIVGRRNALRTRRVMALHLDRRRTLWIGMMDGGLRKLSPNGHIDSVLAKPGDRYSLSAAGVMTLYESNNGRIWIGTYGGGANLLDPSTGLIRQLPYDEATQGATSAANVTAFAEDHNGNVWIGTQGGGLDLARSDGTVFAVFRHNPDDPSSLSANTVYAITVDEGGRVWIGTEGGGLELVRGSSTAPKEIHFDNFSRIDGLTSDTIYGVLPDLSGRLWLSGNAGLMRYDPRTRAAKTFHVEQGAQGEEFDYGASRLLRDGRICFGGPGGFNIFDPSMITEETRPPPLVLTRVEVLGVPWPSPTPYWLLNHIELDSSASIVSLDFGALDFTSAKHNQLSYRMTGLTDRWIDLGTQRRVTLTSLDAGDHTLEVRAATADSLWSDTPLRVQIHRSPAPWKSSWAFVAYAFFVVCLITYGLRNQRRGIAQAIAAQRRLEAEVEARTQELTASNRLLEEAAQAKSEFLARMTHELRTPMNGVVGMTELLERTQQSAMQARFTKTIRSSAGVLLQIVNDLLDLSKAQAGKIVLERGSIDLGLILEEVAAIFAEPAAAKGLDLIVRPPADRELQLVGDSLRIRQILLNLVGNAIKFTERGQIVVEANVGRASIAGAPVEIIVSDTGIGINSSSGTKIFEPFTQADESTTRRFGGTGLGLAICHELISLMGGAITVESRVGEGSTFRVTLTLQTDPARSSMFLETTNRVPAHGDAGSTAPIERIGGHVLVVDDEPVNAAVARGYLATLGCTSVWTEDGPSALGRCAVERFDLVLMDINMPMMDGFATATLIRQRDGPGCHIPIIALTAHDSQIYRARCLAAHMDDLLEKPYTLAAFAAILRKWVVPKSASGREEPLDPADVDALLSIDQTVVSALRNLAARDPRDLYSRLVDLFRTSSATDLARLGAALEANDLKTAGAICHKLKTSATNVGAMSFAANVRKLEASCSTGNANGCLLQMAMLTSAHPRLLDELERLTVRASA